MAKVLVDITFVFRNLSVNELEKRFGCRRIMKNGKDAIEIGNSVFQVLEYEDRLFVFIPLSEISNKDHAKALKNIFNDVLQLIEKVIG